MEYICRVSGAVVVGGEKRVPIENEKVFVIYVTLIDVRVNVIEAVAIFPTQLPPTTFPERGEQERVDPRGRL